MYRRSPLKRAFVAVVLEYMKDLDLDLPCREFAEETASGPVQPDGGGNRV
jgi:hypothetical protein